MTMAGDAEVPAALPWDQPVDPDGVAVALADLLRALPGGFDIDELAAIGWGDHEWLGLGRGLLGWGLANLQHGEVAALAGTRTALAGRRAVELEAQLADEQRHAEVVARYLVEHLGGVEAADEGLAACYDDLLRDGRPDILQLGFQVVVEGYGAALYGMLGPVAAGAGEPLLAALVEGVLADEASHLAWSTAWLRPAYDELAADERVERAALAADLVTRLDASFLAPPLWARLGIAVEDVPRVEPPARAMLRQLLFARVVEGLGAVGLLAPGTPGEEVLRPRLVELGLAAA